MSEKERADRAVNLEIEARHLIVGLGATGISMVKALQQIGVEQITVMDSRETPPNQAALEALGVELIAGAWSAAALDWADYLWLSPGVSMMTPEFQPTLARLPAENIGGDIELLAHLLDRKVPLLAITGTNGKSTVTTQVGAMIEAAGYDLYMGGNLGVPALDLWLQYREEQSPNPCFVLELSSFQLETTTHLAVDVGIILNTTPDHLDRYRDYSHYIESKCRLFSQADAMIIGDACDPIVHRAFEQYRGERATFALSDPKADWSADLEREVICHDAVPFCHYGATRLGGRHNLLNLIAASALCATLGLSADAIESGIALYQPLPHRSLLIREREGVRYYNDSKSTNIASTEAAIDGFVGPKWLILGGVGKGQDFHQLTPALLRGEIVGIYLIGRDGALIAEAIPSSIPCVRVERLEEAVGAIADQAKSGEIVLFSPACASFDQYANFEVRGEHFIALISAL